MIAFRIDGLSWPLAALVCLVLATGMARPQDPAASGPAKGAGAMYTLQRGDVLDIKVFSVPELTETVTVRPDGRISAILLDDIEVAGKTTAELREILIVRYSEFYRDPKVTINVKTFANLKIYVGGEVEAPGVIALAGDLTVGRAIVQAGGIKLSGKSDSVVLVRNGGSGSPVVRKLNLRDILEKGAADEVLMPFDVVFVPKTRIARVNDAVTQYVRQLLPITLTGGFSYLLNNPFPGTER